ncbi:MAG: hypothetical protein ACI4QT_10580 [Kiritimatiellia bacterium]
MTDSTDFSSHSNGEASSPEELFSLAKAHGESFPVLKAFQNYLDQERERARRRTMVLVLSFLGVVVALIVAFVVLFVSFFNVVLRNNEQQQVRILSLVTGEKSVPVAHQAPQPTVVQQPAPAAPAVVQPAAPATEKALTREDLLLLIRELKSQPEAPQPAPATVAPQAEKKPAVSAPVKKTGVLSPVSKQEQMERLRKEEEARKARAAERKRRAEEEAAAKAALAAAEQKTANKAVATTATETAPSSGERVQLKRRPGYGGNQLPKGKEADTIYLQTRSGVIPFRSVLPTTSADVYP